MYLSNPFLVEPNFANTILPVILDKCKKDCKLSDIFIYFNIKNLKK